MIFVQIFGKKFLNLFKTTFFQIPIYFIGFVW